MMLRVNSKYLLQMPVESKYKALNTIYHRHVDYISNKISSYAAHQFCGIVIRLYIKYVIDAILHGYKINITDLISFSIVRIPVNEIYKYRSWKFKSKFTSDWLFYIDIECNTIKNNDIRYTPNNEIIHKVNDVMNSEKVYELIR